MTLLDILNTTEVATAKFQIWQRVGDNPLPVPCHDFPLPTYDEDVALRWLDMLYTWCQAIGYDVRRNDVQSETRTMNTGFVALRQGKFVAAYEIVEVEEQP